MEVELLTVSDAARSLGCSPDLVRWLERQGRLPAIKTAGERPIRLFLRRDVNALAQARRKR